METKVLIEFVRLILDDEYGIPCRAWDYLANNCDSDVLDRFNAIVDSSEGRVFIPEGIADD